jgi:hypothetical protein
MLSSLIAILAATAAASTAAPPASNEAVSSPPPVTQEAADDSDKVVCRYDAETGTRFKTRTCHTKGEWKDMNERAEEMMRQQRARQGLGVTQSNPMGASQ